MEDARLVPYAQKNFASAELLQHTRQPIPCVKDLYIPRPLIPILDRLFIFQSEWSPAPSGSFYKVLATSVSDRSLDIGCAASHGHFAYDQRIANQSFINENKPATALFLFHIQI